MGDQVIEILLFAGVALFLGLRLWSVLGRRTGAERPPQAPPAMRPAQPPNNVVPLGERGRVVDVRHTTLPANPLQAGLDQIRAADANFRVDAFVEGARHAFEIIVKAFADGDTATLRPLVSDEVYDAFSGAIRQRLADKESVETRVVRLQDPELTEAHLDGRSAFVTLKFVSSQISATRDADGKLVEGDPERAVEHTDHWTFSRNTRSSDPNWALAGTGTHE
ncbi:MAG TPA: Tim44/TimA family putative adaptor protein [Aliidongia sp.]|nr:Tim44/TimA family putative adaptor protein [Aliidongia sp.]